VSSLTRLLRVARIATLPETRRAVAAAARSEALRDIRRRAVNDRVALVRDLGDRANARDLLRKAARHPATRELASAGLMFMPVRYVPLGWAASWATQRLLRRYLNRPGGLPNVSDDA
jgi:hypothetical protein